MLRRAVLLSGLVACGEPPPPVDHTARRAAFHASVKADLGTHYNDGADVVLVGANTANGADVYHKSCGNCHGTDLLGRGPRSAGMEPPPVPLVGSGRADLSPAALVHVVTNGSPGTAMAPWGRAFTPEQVRDVVAYVWAQKAAVEAAE